MAKIQFSDTTNKNGVVELLGRATGTLSATAESYPLKVKTVDINSALDYFFYLAQKFAGKTKVDDTGNTAEPKYTINLVSGTQRYNFTVDASSPTNQITGIDRVEILRADGTTKRLTLLNRETVTDSGMAGYKSTAGEPEEYEIVGAGINVYPKPNYNSTNGLILYTLRNGIYFISTDTAVYAGIPNNFHDYLWIRPAANWTGMKGLPQAVKLENMKIEMEGAIEDHYRRINKDSTRGNAMRMRPSNESNK